MNKVIYNHKATLHCDSDAIYSVEFDEILRECKAWELDPMNDTIAKTRLPTGKMRVTFVPDVWHFTFREDLARNQIYEMGIEDARTLYRDLRENKNYWFALDMASYYQRKMKKSK